MQNSMNIEAPISPAASIESALMTLRDKRKLAYFFDVDGTLFEIVPEPRDVVADSSLKNMISSIADHAGGALALVSGREIRELDRIFTPLRLPAAGLHGAEIRFSDGSLFAAPSHLVEPFRPECRRFVASHPGLALEDKGATLAIHFRQRPDLSAAVVRFLGKFGPERDVAVQEGKMVAELKPAKYDKGTAVAEIMKTAPFAGRIPVFFGDDLTDEAGFRCVNTMAGMSVRVGAPVPSTLARLHVATPAALRNILGHIITQSPDYAVTGRVS